MTGPFASPIASTTTVQKSPNRAAKRVLVPMQDLRPPVRISTSDLPRIHSQLSDRDLDLMRLVGRLKVMSTRQLTDLYWPQGLPATRTRMTRKTLRRLCELGVLEALDRTVGGVRAGSAGTTFAVGRAGQRLLAADQPQRRVRRVYTPGARYLTHTLAVSQLYVDLVLAERQGMIERLEIFAPEPECWRTYPGRFGARLAIKPDAYVRLRNGGYELSFFIERDMATEAAVTIERKAGRYRDYWQTGTEQHARGVFPRVVWITPSERRNHDIREALERLPGDATRLFAVVTSEQAVALLGGGDRS